MNQKIIWLCFLLASYSMAHSQNLGMPLPSADTALIQSSDNLLELAPSASIYLGGSWNPHLPGYHETQLSWRQPLNSRTQLEASFGNIAFAGTQEYRIGLRVQRRFRKVMGALAWSYGKEDFKAGYAERSFQHLRAVLGYTPASRWKYFVDWQVALSQENTHQHNLNLVLFHQASDQLSFNGIAHISTGSPLFALQAVYGLRKPFKLAMSLSTRSSLGFTMQYRSRAFCFQMRLHYQRAFGFLPQHAMTYAYS